MTDDKFTENGRQFYKASGKRVWPRRNREFEQPDMPLIEAAHVRTLLEQLDQLEKKTRPSGGEETANGKDMAAFRALKIAGDLVRHVAGWAIDHQLGLAAKDMGFVPRGTPQAEAHPDYLIARLVADSHENERIGAASAPLDPKTERLALINLLRANPGGFPQSVQRPTIEALEALDFKEVSPMLAPAKGDRKVKLTELRMQLEVVGFVEFQIATGIKKYEAVKTAARILCVADSTITGWEYRLRDALGYLTVMRALSRYSSWGRSFKTTKERWAAGEESNPEAFQMFEDMGGLPALQKVAAKYKALEK